MNDFDHYLEWLVRDMYSRELEYRDKLTNSLSLPISILTILASIVGSYFREMVPPHLGVLAILWWLVFGLFCSSVCLGAYCVIRSLHRHTYAYLAKPDELLAHIEKLKGYYREYYPTEDANELAQVAFRRSLIQEYAKYATENIKTNRKRIRYRHRAITFVVASLLSFALIFVLSYGLVGVSDPIQGLNSLTTQGKDSAMPKDDQKPHSPQQSEIQQPAPPPPPPPFPPGDRIEEGGDPTRIK